ncbi:hypothetical protein BJ508DRAFT_314844 [Ascobolus immersus RN42]|uniref:Uncharacterized protein n=1 Tax=Ascobolus immersus RN42 TaxID=1160509 RepID=A0A3N4HRP0_ASCIM|nr:hypothetical protein BJ508DRAFT_314844 [Ascobolus immersus RN42]
MVETVAKREAEANRTSTDGRPKDPRTTKETTYKTCLYADPKDSTSHDFSTRPAVMLSGDDMVKEFEVFFREGVNRELRCPKCHLLDPVVVQCNNRLGTEHCGFWKCQGTIEQVCGFEYHKWQFAGLNDLEYQGAYEMEEGCIGITKDFILERQREIDDKLKELKAAKEEAEKCARDAMMKRTPSPGPAK